MIIIVDYGLGNIKAFANICNRLNLPFGIAQTATDLMAATKIILPGVGSFDHAMKSLEQSGMRSALDHLVLKQQIPVLGVCVGMQMLAKSSEEGHLPGLAWIDGVVKKFDVVKLQHNEPLPHMGWNSVKKFTEHALFQGLPQDPYFYFLHSYYFVCDKAENILATTYYGENFSCIINSDNIYGIQCHPEKSHQNGITFLKNFGNL